ncbi:uncharacterized protein sS8_2473 [Methylocaldum marinum]|uniref:Uncharacterized protein n=1 Tax=Methylocaldum marinum TaxID=1432792 RepID=A0A250KRY3_9GAMM|nr:hypothetical protein [Methylocaldum marinum]BBA34425.1 uncharacterized protein sS8_2473 [Methylocaldum marinum]
MNQMSLSHAVHLGVEKINRAGTVFKPDTPRLVADFHMSSGTSGVIALSSESGHKVSRQGYELVKFSTPNVPTLEVTVDDIWACAKEHYGLAAATAVAGAGGIPISKLLLGHRWAPGSSKYTNLVSHFGHKFFPMATLPYGSTAARVAKSTFGTIRVFGVIGRALPFAAVGLAVYDVISIGMCAYEERNRK